MTDETQGKFYELYELDAEIGHKELDWKMTLSGVGKCRQVTSKINLSNLKANFNCYNYSSMHMCFI